MEILFTHTIDLPKNWEKLKKLSTDEFLELMKIQDQIDGIVHEEGLNSRVLGKIDSLQEDSDKEKTNKSNPLETTEMAVHSVVDNSRRTSEVMIASRRNRRKGS